MSWHVKYAPHHIKHFVGNAQRIAQIKTWLSTFHSRRRADPETATRCLLLSGPMGIGKTLCIRLLSKHFGCECVELNAASRENKKAFLDTIEATLVPPKRSLTSLAGKRSASPPPNILLIEEINAIVSSGKGSSELKTLLQCLARAMRPLICITDERGEEGIRRLVSCATRVEFVLPDINDIASFLYRIGVAEGWQRSTSTNLLQQLCARIATQSQGDIRKAVLQLQTYKFSVLDNTIGKDNNNNTLASSSLQEYTSFFDTYGPQAIYHTMEHYAFKYVGKKRGRKPTKKTCYRDNVKTTLVPQACRQMNANQRAEHYATIADALSQADVIRETMQTDHHDQEMVGLDSVLPYLAYTSCGVAFALSDSAIPLDRIDFPSHTSTCKRYLSSLRTLLDRTRSALFQPKATYSDDDDNDDDVSTVAVPPPYTIFMTRNAYFCALILPALKLVLSQPLVKLGERGIDNVLAFAKKYHIDTKDLDFIYKCGTYSGQERITKHVEKRLRQLLDKKLKAQSIRG